MKYPLRKLFLLVLLACCNIGWAQELDINVTVNGERVQTQEQQVFTDLQNAMEKFLLSQEWTTDTFEEFERIKSNIQVTLNSNTDINNQVYEANVQIQSLRPVYGTDYETPVMNYLDNKWLFSYRPSDPMIFSENTYSTELTSLMAYYSYLILALDYDTFSPKGGTPFYERALNIANYSQQSGGRGWDQLGDKRDRVFLIRDLTNPLFEPFREALYEYHRLGMDKFEENPDEARKVILSALRKIEQVRDAVPISITIDMFFDTKAPELINVFSQGDKTVIAEAVQLMIKLNPTNANKFRKLL
ncbi:DUF4835 family protein [Limibacter armeniacum]|uniref:type IX secretion system protein PorD n=1 Tax=Limibacter armeniacum TaxID=466084 RepID=UPI002FE6986F